mmetsp:Transcript_106211/g.199971  ORF Transcript_106211/g.199971 Transcript_106211/m.199971 type:complete len:86 (-) Transcript_106211:526-783(-)
MVFDSKSEILMHFENSEPCFNVPSIIESPTGAEVAGSSLLVEDDITSVPPEFNIALLSSFLTVSQAVYALNLVKSREVVPPELTT